MYCAILMVRTKDNLHIMLKRKCRDYNLLVRHLIMGEKKRSKAGERMRRERPSASPRLAHGKPIALSREAMGVHSQSARGKKPPGTPLSML
jgi:hypothetical protein